MKPMRHHMSKILAFSRFSVRDFLATAGPTLLLVGAFCALAYWLVDPAPPRQVSLSTGQDNSAYEEFGKKYAATLAKHGIKVTLQPSLGSQENLQRLNSGKTDIAFVQSGSTEHADAERQGLISLGSLFTEPVWLFLREDKAVTELTQLKGMKINLGPEGTGVPGLFRQLLSVNGVEANELTVSDLQNTPATVELLEGRIDGLVFSSAPEAPLIQMLLQTPGIKLFDFSQAEAYTRRLPFLTHVVLPRGIVDLGRNIPAQDYHLIAPTATLVAREDLHPALVDLFVQAAATHPWRHGLVPAAGAVPVRALHGNSRGTGSAKFYKDGAPVLQRYMSFWLANFFDRMWVLVVALGRPDPAAVARGAAAVRVAHPLARVPLVRPAAHGGAGAGRRAARAARASVRGAIASGSTRSRKWSTRYRFRCRLPMACMACAATSISCASAS